MECIEQPFITLTSGIDYPGRRDRDRRFTWDVYETIAEVWPGVSAKSPSLKPGDSVTLVWILRWWHMRETHISIIGENRYWQCTASICVEFSNCPLPIGCSSSFMGCAARLQLIDSPNPGRYEDIHKHVRSKHLYITYVCLGGKGC